MAEDGRMTKKLVGPWQDTHRGKIEDREEMNLSRVRRVNNQQVRYQKRGMRKGLSAGSNHLCLSIRLALMSTFREMWMSVILRRACRL